MAVKTGISNFLEEIIATKSAPKSSTLTSLEAISVIDQCETSSKCETQNSETSHITTKALKNQIKTVSFNIRNPQGFTQAVKEIIPLISAYESSGIAPPSEPSIGLIENAIYSSDDLEMFTVLIQLLKSAMTEYRFSAAIQAIVMKAMICLSRKDPKGIATIIVHEGLNVMILKSMTIHCDVPLIQKYGNQLICNTRSIVAYNEAKNLDSGASRAKHVVGKASSIVESTDNEKATAQLKPPKLGLQKSQKTNRQRLPPPLLNESFQLQYSANSAPMNQKSAPRPATSDAGGFYSKSFPTKRMRQQKKLLRSFEERPTKEAPVSSSLLQTYGEVPVFVESSTLAARKGTKSRKKKRPGTTGVRTAGGRPRSKKLESFSNQNRKIESVSETREDSGVVEFPKEQNECATKIQCMFRRVSAKEAVSEKRKENAVSKEIEQQLITSAPKSFKKCTGAFQKALKLQQSGDVEKAIRTYESILQLPGCTGSSAVFNNLGSALMLRKEYQNAALHFQKALRNENLKARYNLGIALFYLGKIHDAKSELELVLMEQGSHAKAKYAIHTIERQFKVNA